ncbi:histidine kinase [Sphingomonas melonis TY]|jgi:signal transduction histidine kinase|uniref:histidine kinase n=1 Tax=Sphingomonas melonis TY TaxID=621456 RepID=A0A175Y4E2_9SPHN|nr:MULTISPECIES: HAMP domain-containing sensor histidine kinase [Sphingomonas]AOW25468.1 ATP-binding protein [Sphingomonas melonis TY]ATI57440.1 sensor histidine kinase [Sphingomonas melonis]KZB95226.1 histidine kinase [Sphingomonas melonis TY]MCM2300488.1 HAMP domain-containing histidine kinase [Sphingomonas sp.]
MMPRSLQGRMLLLSAVAILAALGIAGWAIAGVLERVVTEGIDRRLDAEIALMASVVDGDGRVDRAALAQRQGALDAGRDWLWRIEAPGGAIGSTDRFVPRPDAARPGPRLPGPPGPPPPGVAPLPDAGPQGVDGTDASGARLHARRLVLTTRSGPVTLFAAAPRGVIARPLREALVPLLAALAILAGLLATATLVQLRLGLKPLARLRAQLAAIRAGEAERVDEDQPVELQGLAAELNALAADRAQALATARQSAANLAHALKTPVATLALRLRADAEGAAQVERIDATIRHHLARARAGVVDTRASTAVRPAVADLVQAIGRLHGMRGLAITGDVRGDPVAAIEPQDFDELLGNLLDNAAQHARSMVQASASLDPADARRLVLTVADDGPGIPEEERSRVTQAGVRLDERGEGHGFGLAIVRELASLHGGALTLDAREGGGLVAQVTLPARAFV